MESLDSSMVDVDLLSIPSPVIVQQDGEVTSVGEATSEDVIEQPQVENIMDNQVPDVSASSQDLKQFP